MTSVEEGMRGLQVAEHQSWACTEQRSSSIRLCVCVFLVRVCLLDRADDLCMGALVVMN